MAPPFMDLNQTPTISIDEVTGRRRLDNPLQNLGLLDPSTLIQERGYVDTARTTVQEDLKGLLGNIESKKVSPRTGSTTAGIMAPTDSGVASLPNKFAGVVPGVKPEITDSPELVKWREDRVLDRFSSAETNRTFDSKQKQAGSGPAFGAFQYEPDRFLQDVFIGVTDENVGNSPKWLQKVYDNLKKSGILNKYGYRAKATKDGKYSKKNYKAKTTNKTKSNKSTWNKVNLPDRNSIRKEIGNLSYEQQRDLVRMSLKGTGLDEVDIYNPDELAKYWMKYHNKTNTKSDRYNSKIENFKKLTEKFTPRKVSK